MRSEQTPVFVARRTYHGRRMADAARLLPIFGAVLLVIPLLWRNPEAPAGTVAVMLYIFVVWTFLIGTAAILSRRIPRDEVEVEQAEDQRDEVAQRKAPSLSPRIPR